jgi:hypothetical protein
VGGNDARCDVIMLADIEPDVSDDEGAYGWCKRCECEAPIVKQDMGIGRFEYHGSKEIHRDMQWVCRECGDQI